MRVTVLFGGPSAEREVSLVSGQAVIDGLRSMGHEVYGSDVSPADLSFLMHPADVIFPVLHGQFGESGELQEILETNKKAFVGSGAKASHLGIHKTNTKLAWQQAGLSTPKWIHVSHANFDPTRGVEGLFVPCVVKADSSGSSIDVFLCKSHEQAIAAISTVVDKHGSALVEQYIDGPELTIGLLEEQPLAPIRIVAKAAFFDFEAKYKANDTQHLFDTGLPAEVVENCRALAKRANDVVGAIDLARIDIMLDAEHNPYLLEINTLPGFTPKSLLPEAAAHAGIPFGELVDRLVKRAAERGPRGPKPG